MLVYSRSLRTLSSNISFQCRRLLSDNGNSRRYEYLDVESREKVGLMTLNRPSALNALNSQLCNEIVDAVANFNADLSVGAMVLTGSDRAFAAGADIKEMASRSYASARFKHDMGNWISSVANSPKPIVCAVNGFALGGGCELALACDIVLASENAQFGQPEIQLGTIPGWGGTQRLIRAIGKAKAMEMVLTGRRMGATEAESSGLIARVIPANQLLDEAIKVASTIASYSTPVVTAAKECMLEAFNMGLRDGLLFERRQFQSTFALDDQKEGMKAFIDKRSPEWKDR
eukprot:Plantae.Rhodophyta-Purpureofilum_apyrenoidigerum.ctg6591.p1 GENE.Plantae.Rhodophyta-Purpureofilum_apyrenoidigerum.ctg6591~~Plantae.Rhodophyta-Purpureofilum_apyrenoidigerum.ctg6591.p1  ORF type:complete len:288 (+),score=41.51 Plantae.Rhodophyta-Purpureofilum_apyrenoidigerum.ctg6591:117-980(+)